MKNMTLKEIAVACGGIYYGDDESYYKEVSSVVIDSRKVEKDCLFIHSRCKSGWTHVHPADDPGRRSVCALRKAD